LSSLESNHVVCLREFLDAIEQHRPTRTPMIEGARTLELVLAANRAGETGQVVKD